MIIVGILPAHCEKLSAERDSYRATKPPETTNPLLGCGAVKQNEALDANPRERIGDCHRLCERTFMKSVYAKLRLPNGPCVPEMAQFVGF
jgi:hypothetical protein